MKGSFSSRPIAGGYWVISLDARSQRVVRLLLDEDLKEPTLIRHIKNRMRQELEAIV